MSPIRNTTQAIREIGAGAIGLRALAMGLLAGAIFDEPIERAVVAVALGALLFGEAAHWAHLHFQRKYPR